jgi:hypothetical protein
MIVLAIPGCMKLYYQTHAFLVMPYPTLPFLTFAYVEVNGTFAMVGYSVLWLWLWGGYMTASTYAELQKEGGPEQYVTLLSVLGGLYWLGPIGAVAGPFVLSIPGIVWELFEKFCKPMEDEGSFDSRAGSPRVSAAGDGRSSWFPAGSAGRRQSPNPFGIELLHRATGLTFATRPNGGSPPY